MKNPLNKRILRELKDDLGKYISIFLFIVMLISIVSAFLIADSSIRYAYEEGFSKYNLEWGHFTLSDEPSDEFLEELSENGDVTLHDLRYFEEDESSKGATIRVYEIRDKVNLECVMSGSLPASRDEIALDRMYAQNAGFEIGDTITLNDHKLTITGLIAVPDYSCLFENNTDMMFDSINFSIAVMTSEGFQSVGSTNLFYNYAWMYTSPPTDDIEEKQASDDFLEVLKDTLTDYNQERLLQNATLVSMVASLISDENTIENQLITVEQYIPRYNNQAINFTGDDMSGDKAMILLFAYIVIVILAFVFAVTISNTISQEATVIGTLRASGYTRGELLRHYMVLPTAVTLIGAVIGNVIGYTFLKSVMVTIYYNSYSLCTYQTLWNAEAFIDTTVIPIILMFVINLFVLIRKLQLSPLKFLRRELTSKKTKRIFPLSKKISFLHRFRIRIIIQNLPNYITMFFGIVFAAILIIFGLMFGPLLEDYAELVSNSMISTYQYVLKSPVETDSSQAEKYCLSELETTDTQYMIDQISIYGIEDNSSYITKDIPDGQVLVSNGIMKKFGLKTGDTITLKECYDSTTYDFLIAGEYTYDAALTVFMTKTDYLEMFDKDSDYFTGYFSNEKLTDLDEADIATVITKEDLTKISRQLQVSMGDFMNIYKVFGVIMFILLMYLLSRQIIEKNAQSISMIKILGFTDGEIGRLYIVSTSIIVVISLLLAVPITDAILRFLFSSYIYTEMTGYIPYIVSKNCFIEMVVLGIICYVFVSILQLFRISKIPKSDALKNIE